MKHLTLKQKIKHQTQYRVYYKDTDTGQVMYYAKYAELFEIGRTELFRKINLNPNLLMQEKNILIPVIELNIKYLKPAIYDDLLTIETILEEMSSLKLQHTYLIFNQNNQLLCQGKTTNVFIDKETLKPKRLKIDTNYINL